MPCNMYVQFTQSFRPYYHRRWHKYKYLREIPSSTIPTSTSSMQMHLPKRDRAIMACLRCREKKLKVSEVCSGIDYCPPKLSTQCQLPSGSDKCQRCIDSGEECQYTRIPTGEAVDPRELSKAAQSDHRKLSWLKRQNKAPQTKARQDWNADTAVGRYAHHFPHRHQRQPALTASPLAHAALSPSRRSNLMNNVSVSNSLGMRLVQLCLPHRRLKRLGHKGEHLYTPSEGYLIPPPPAAPAGKDITASNTTQAGCESIESLMIYLR